MRKATTALVWFLAISLAAIGSCAAFFGTQVATDAVFSIAGTCTDAFQSVVSAKKNPNQLKFISCGGFL